MSLPTINPLYIMTNLSEMHRQSASMLADLDDRSIQLLLREIESETLLAFLWYMKDSALIKRFLSNMSKRAAEILMDDLFDMWSGKNADTVSEDLASQGQLAIAEIMTSSQRLIDEGLLPNIRGRLSQRASPSNFSANNTGALHKAVKHDEKVSTISPEHHSVHVTWLACLYCVLSKVRRSGLMSIEEDVEHPESKVSIFSNYPLVLKQPYLDFATDMLRMMHGGSLHSENLNLYSEIAIDRMTTFRWFRKVDRSILELISLTLQMAVQGYSPRVACEFGRQAIPFGKKPSFQVLEKILIGQERILGFLGRSVQNLDDEVDRFVQSLQS